MSLAARRLNRAIQITPPLDRDRYAEEWRYDMSSAAELGISPWDVVRGATRVAWRLRMRLWGRNLAGAEGGGRAAAAWALVVAILPVPLLIGGPILLLVIPAAMIVALFLAHQGHSRVGSIVMLGSAVLWLACTIVFWWLWGVGFDATDALQPQPPVMKWALPTLWVGIGAFVTFWVAFVVSVFRRSSARAAS
ncbi:MAG: hypothetical protein ACYCV4_16100 [Dermatophilaceae bacterium]